MKKYCYSREIILHKKPRFGTGSFNKAENFSYHFNIWEVIWNGCKSWKRTDWNLRQNTWIKVKKSYKTESRYQLLRIFWLWKVEWAPGNVTMCAPNFETILMLPNFLRFKALIIWQLVRKLVHKVCCVIYQVPFYLWRMGPVLKCLILFVYWRKMFKSPYLTDLYVYLDLLVLKHYCK